MKTQNKKDKTTYYKQNVFMNPPTYKINFQKSHN